MSIIHNLNHWPSLVLSGSSSNCFSCH